MINQLHYTPNALRTPDSLSGPSLPQSSGPPLSSNFPKSSDFSGATSFNLPAQADTTLLSPDSATESPQGHHPTKFPTPYPTPPSCSTSLLHEQTTNGRMYGQWNSAFELNAPSSQASSPMTSQPALGAEFLESYGHGHDGRRTPGPPEQSYMGHFGVTDSQPLGHSGAPSYYVGLPSVDQQGGHSTMMRSYTQGIPDPRTLGRGGHPPGPLLNHSTHSYRDDRRESIPEAAYQGRSMNGSPRSTNATQSGRVRKSRRSKRQGSATSKGTSNDSEILGEYMNCRGQEVPPALKDTCPEEERCIFDSRWRHRKVKGQTMWDGIQEDYKQYFGRTPPGKETLQMKFKRARSKYIEWLPEDVERLRAAWKEMEDERYETLLQKFHKKGGSRNMLLNATDIEVKVVNDLKLEEGMYMHAFKEHENMDVRRRQKANPPKKRSGGRTASQTQAMPALVKMEHDDDVLMGSQAEDEVIKQIQDSRRDDDRGDDGGSDGGHQHAAGRWGPGVGMLGTPLWDNRQGVNNIMPPMSDHLLGHGGGPGVHRR